MPSPQYFYLLLKYAVFILPFYNIFLHDFYSLVLSLLIDLIMNRWTVLFALVLCYFSFVFAQFYKKLRCIIFV